MLDPLHAADDDWYLQEFPKVFAWIGPAALPGLRHYLANAAHADFPRICAAHALKDLAERHPAVRDEAVNNLREALWHFESNDPMLNSFLIRYLLDMKAPEAAEVIDRAAASGRVNPDITGQWRSEH
jgi:hypothetical protein